MPPERIDAAVFGKEWERECNAETGGKCIEWGSEFPLPFAVLADEDELPLGVDNEKGVYPLCAG